MKLLLINPISQYRKGLADNHQFKKQPLGLGIIAALTPKNWDVEIVDENFEEFCIREADLVGITAYTSTAYRAYQIATLFREKGIKTVIGGIHASALPEEASQFADCIVVGEAESVWEEIIKDFEKGNLKKRYIGQHVDLSGLPTPRYDLFSKKYLFTSVQTTRGCPMNCVFCSVSSFNGHTYRQRPVEEVLNELQGISNKMIFFVDDNIIGYGEQSEARAMSLFQGMIDRKFNKQWVGHASLNFGTNAELLKLASKSGCRMIFLGIEAESVGALKEFNKRLNLKIGTDKINTVVDSINNEGIAVLGGFIFGNDSDTPDDLKRRNRFMLKSKIGVPEATVYTPFPGTLLYEKMAKENRLLFTNYPEDWQRYDFKEVVFIPKNMTPEELNVAIKKTWKKLYKNWRIKFRYLRSKYNKRNRKASSWILETNKQYRRIALKT